MASRGCRPSSHICSVLIRMLRLRNSCSDAWSAERRGMQADQVLERDVRSELRWIPELDDPPLAVRVTDGAVTLSGHVGSFLERTAAERAVRRVRGVAGITNDIEVRLPPQGPPPRAQPPPRAHAAAPP